LHVWNWPANGKLVVPGLNNKVKSATLLATGEKLKTSADADGVTIEVPATAPDAISSTIVLKIKGAPDVSPVYLNQADDGSIHLAAVDATLGGGLQYEAGGGKDCIGYWADPKDSPSWTFTVKRPGEFRVTAEVATRGTASFTISVGDQTVAGSAPDTGDYTQFQSIKLDRVLDIRTPGAVTLVVRPVAAGWNPINLKSITLLPEINDPVLVR
jgi:alpha-L-fucosidase